MTTNIRDILAERQTTHGDYTEHSRITQNLKAMMHDTPNWNRLTADQIETLEMVAHKIGRILAGDPEHLDSWLDCSGYFTLSADRVRDRNKPVVTNREIADALSGHVVVRHTAEAYAAE